ncbi:hypothetical protein CPL64_28265, partial [Klebsiella pneumoniae]
IRAVRQPHAIGVDGGDAARQHAANAARFKLLSGGAEYAPSASRTPSASMAAMRHASTQRMPRASSCCL